MTSLTQEGQKYPLNSNKQLVKYQHTHTRLWHQHYLLRHASGVPPFSSWLTPLREGGINRDRRSRRGWESGSSRGDGVLCFKSAPSYGPTTLLTSQLGPSDRSNAIPPQGKATFPELVRGRFENYASDDAFTKITAKPKTVWQLEFP